MNRTRWILVLALIGVVVLTLVILALSAAVFNITGSITPTPTATLAG
jgi:hypothetical protein